jgi:hypothetical protein
LQERLPVISPENCKAKNMANPVPSMNAMVDSITDTVDSAIHHGQTAGGLRRHMLHSSSPFQRHPH